MIIRKKQKTHYTVMPNALVTDKELSWEARGMMLYLMSKPDEWTVVMADLQNASQAGETKVRRIIHELMDTGYITKSVSRGKTGQFVSTDYVVSDTKDANWTPEEKEKVVEMKSRKKVVGSKVDPEFKITETMSKWAAKQGVVNEPALHSVTCEFINYWVGTGKTKLDWTATWKNWIMAAMTEDHFGYRRALTVDPANDVAF